MSEKQQLSEKRRRWTAKAKLEVVLEGLRGQESVAEICRRHGITQSMYYEWQEAVFKAAEEDLTHGGRTAREAELEKQLRQAQRTIGRLTMENELYQKKTRLARPSAEEVVAFYHREAKQYPIDLVCRVMGISRSAFYKALSRKRESHQVKPDPDECRLVARIKELVARFPDGSQFGSRAFVNEADRLGIELTYTPYRSPQGNAIVERFFRSLKEECVWHYRFESFHEAERVISDWIRFYNDERLH